MNHREQQDLHDFIAATALFEGVAGEGISDICKTTRTQAVAPGTLVFRQGGEAKRAYALMAGSLRIVQAGIDGRQSVNRFIIPGEIFGAVPMFCDRKYPADAEAMEASTVLSWSEADLLRLIDQHPRIAINIIRTIGARLAEVQTRLNELASLSLERRIASALLRLAKQAGSPRDSMTAIDIPLRRKDLAEITGTTLHSASRTLAAWESNGLLVSLERRIVIKDLAALTRIAQESPPR
ncbi:Crp/Fnr family transcriptional regulator [Parahaliea mediterranea]|uniref:Crp/Fnr family transcriptional regulator n=1 Tax=Parahaliea mediterranea TaxID=651086 RepID=UPI0019D41414|nr:Crp/Fnr family transcriptional regulator [Parahaliea mediterranea]